MKENRKLAEALTTIASLQNNKGHKVVREGEEMEAAKAVEVKRKERGERGQRYFTILKTIVTYMDMISTIMIPVIFVARLLKVIVVV